MLLNIFTSAFLWSATAGGILPLGQGGASVVATAFIRVSIATRAWVSPQGHLCVGYGQAFVINSNFGTFSPAFESSCPTNARAFRIKRSSDREMMVILISPE